MKEWGDEWDWGACCQVHKESIESKKRKEKVKETYKHTETDRQTGRQGELTAFAELYSHHFQLLPCYLSNLLLLAGLSVKQVMLFSSYAWVSFQATRLGEAELRFHLKPVFSPQDPCTPEVSCSYCLLYLCCPMNLSNPVMGHLGFPWLLPRPSAFCVVNSKGPTNW